MISEPNMQLILESVRRQSGAPTHTDTVTGIGMSMDGVRSKAADLRSIQDSFEASVQRGIQQEKERQQAVDVSPGLQKDARSKGD